MRIGLYPLSTGLFNGQLRTFDTERSVGREISKKLRESLDKRGEKYEGIDRRTQKLEGIPAKPGGYKITLTVKGTSVTKPLTVREDPLLN